ncbi:MAG: hypothetical protein D6725_17670 [Planctomycetota bacterium]|nr:MAG: hypothetical protein D6725_17670 [Planctomycetota bacterium]
MSQAAHTPETAPPFELGVTVLGDFIVSEGPRAVLDRLQDCGVTHVTFNPTVTEPAAEGDGVFQPPVDAGASPRRFDRPLFGKTAIWLRSAVSFRPRPDLYRGCVYGPRRADELTERLGPKIAEFVDLAIRRGFRLAVQLGAAQPTGLRDEDRPRLPDESLPQGRMADTACLAAPEVRAYNRAYLADVLRAYPQVQDVRIDWPEYPCYTFPEAFQGFGPHVRRWAEARGEPYEPVRRDVAAFWERLHGGLSNRHLEAFAEDGWSAFHHARHLLRYRGVACWLRWKAELSCDLIGHWRTALDEATGTARPRRRLIAHAFMPPYSLLTGLDFGRLGQYADAVAAKLYTMHWPMMLRFWGSWLRERNPTVDERLLTAALERLMELTPPDDPQRGSRSLRDWRYPRPEEPHPIALAVQRAKLLQAVRAADTTVFPLIHGYGPLEDFRRRLRLAIDPELCPRGVLVNRYGYLSDGKLEILDNETRASTAGSR